LASLKKYLYNRYTSLKNYIFHLFQFSTILKLLEFYVLILSILAILVTIRIWDIEVKPELSILKPIYCFNSQKILEDISKPPYKDIVNNDDSLRDLFYAYFYNIDPIVGTKNSYAAFDYIKPNREVSEVSGYLVDDIWYLNGLRDTFYYLPNLTTDLKATRSEVEKMKGIKLLLAKSLFIDSDSLHKSDTINWKNRSLSFYQPTLNNPLQIIYKNFKNDTLNLSSLIFMHTKIYSCLSISNNSNQTIEDVHVTINDIFFHGLYSLFGWTLAGNVKEIIKSPNTIQFTIDRIEAGQSIEILIKGIKYMRNNDVKLTYSGLSYVNKGKVIFYMIAIAIMVLLFDLLFWILSRRIRLNQKLVEN